MSAKRIIVVTHGGFMLAFMSVINESLMRFDQYVSDVIPNYLSGMKNCSISVFEMNNKKFKLIMWGSRWHLNNFIGGSIEDKSNYEQKYHKYKQKYLLTKITKKQIGSSYHKCWTTSQPAFTYKISNHGCLQ